MIGFYPDVLGLLGLSDLFIQPTLLELHSITMLEAMSLGVPALVSKGVGCNDDFLSHGKNGYLLDPKDPESWAAALRSLLADPGEARRIGQAGRELVESRCDIRKTAEKFETLYAGILVGV